jgi:hypothetical protein
VFSGVTKITSLVAQIADQNRVDCLEYSIQQVKKALHVLFWYRIEFDYDFSEFFKKVLNDFSTPLGSEGFSRFRNSCKNCFYGF